ncbi:sulfite exporter TauE/SafE family protein [Legionella bononiensis]|uniref:Probable membrane transporter protein n=1 Tax=Legionella bononiensis TaxID=2793102 RepID=A0ABS1WFY5_9GAMM|nr:sulfite exporter TauE/SafE family protein [Legionella bononiensis]MBL7481720.1 sulfite exporter TauE/SafE family protein [Legionella bononiensis]MBL7528268.1 sulfite exporter TauE/SafE family protein [Legionella bononiensis]MBL7562743.1 sulfite exporter TauE/SafE family protein [Legionella bononiensis]
MMLHGYVYILIGVFAGLMSGALGVGGGIILVPGLVFVFQSNHLIPENSIMHVAAATSLAIMVFASLSSMRVHYKIGEILWSVFAKIWPGLVLGVISGVIASNSVPTSWLKMIFGFFLFFITIRMLTKKQVTNPGQFPGYWVNGLINYLIGMLSGSLGIGGGGLIVPYLEHCGVAIRKISSVSNLCTLTVGVLGALVSVFTGWNEMADIPYTTGYIYWPAVLLVGISSSFIAPFGAKLNYVLPVNYLRYGFIVILMLMAIKMIFF